MNFFVIFAATAILFLAENVASKATVSKDQKDRGAIEGNAEGIASDVLMAFVYDISDPDGPIQLLNNKFKDIIRRVGILEDESAGTAFYIKKLKDTLDEVTDTTEMNRLDAIRKANIK